MNISYVGSAIITNRLGVEPQLNHSAPDVGGKTVTCPAHFHYLMFPLLVMKSSSLKVMERLTSIRWIVQTTMACRHEEVGWHLGQIVFPSDCQQPFGSPNSVSDSHHQRRLSCRMIEHNRQVDEAPLHVVLACSKSLSGSNKSRDSGIFDEASSNCFSLTPGIENVLFEQWNTFPLW